MDLAQFTGATWAGAALALVLALGIIAVGISYLVAPEASSRGFGFRSEITPEVIPWQHIKGPATASPDSSAWSCCSSSVRRPRLSSSWSRRSFRSAMP